MGEKTENGRGTAGGRPYARQKRPSSPLPSEATMSRIALTAAVLSLPFLALSTPAQARAEANAKASAKSSGGDSLRSNSSSSHKVVVINGKTVVDEKTVDGKKVRGGKRRGRKLGKLDVDTDELLRRARTGKKLDGMMKDLKRRLVRNLPKGMRVVEVSVATDADKAGIKSSGRRKGGSSKSAKASMAKLKKMLRGISSPKGTKKLMQQIDAALEKKGSKGGYVHSRDVDSRDELEQLEDELAALRKKIDAAAKKTPKSKKRSRTKTSSGSN